MSQLICEERACPPLHHSKLSHFFSVVRKLSPQRLPKYENEVLIMSLTKNAPRIRPFNLPSSTAKEVNDLLTHQKPPFEFNSPEKPRWRVRQTTH